VCACARVRACVRAVKEAVYGVRIFQLPCLAWRQVAQARYTGTQEGPDVMNPGRGSTAGVRAKGVRNTRTSGASVSRKEA